MKYPEFKRQVKGLPLIFTRDLVLHRQDKQAVRNQLERWRSSGLVIKLKRGVFLLNKDDALIHPSRAYIANQLYSPSYVSLEYALGHYGIIPERVSDVTSVTSKKTFTIDTGIGRFVYQHIKTAAFGGFTAEKDEAGLSYFIALPEKALVDFCYLNIEKFKGDYTQVFAESYRFQNTEGLDRRKVLAFARLYENGKLARIAKALNEFIKKER